MAEEKHCSDLCRGGFTPSVNVCGAPALRLVLIPTLRAPGSRLRVTKEACVTDGSKPYAPALSDTVFYNNHRSPGPTEVNRPSIYKRG